MQESTIRVTRLAKGSGHYGPYLLAAGQPVNVPMSFLEQFGGDPALRFEFGDIADKLASRTSDGRPLFDWWCNLSAVDGYGRHALDIWRELRRMGVEARLKTSGRFYDRPHLDPDILGEFYHHRSSLPSKVGVSMSVPYHEMNWDHQSITKVVITQFETDRVPPGYVECVNRCDHLITTSHFQPAVWKKSGCKLPISVLTPGVDTDFFSYTPRSADGPFKVLILGALTERKNWRGAIRIFQAASEGDPNWQLTIKTRNTKEVNAMAMEARQDNRIRFLTGDLSPEQIRHLYYDHHAFLWPSKGEGVGLPPLEAMATGMEVVCSDNSGMSDYLNEDHAYLIPTAGKESAGPPHGFSAEWVAKWGTVGQWWIPDEKRGVKQLLKAHDYVRGGCGKGEKAAAYVREHHTLRHQAESVLRVVETYL